MFSIPSPGRPTRTGGIVPRDVGPMSQDHRNQADWLEKLDFLLSRSTSIPKSGMLCCLRAIARDLLARSDPTFDDVEACPYMAGGPSRAAREA